jgi:hypothetical protein
MLWSPPVRFGVVALLTVLCGACYTAVGTSHDALRPGVHVYVDLTESGTTNVARYVGPNVRQVYGDVRENSGGGLIIALRSVTDRQAIETPWAGESLAIPRAEIVSIRERRLSRRRSWVLATAVTAALLAGARAFGVLGGGEGHRGDLPVGQ